jgi:hypothetical protein
MRIEGWETEIASFLQDFVSYVDGNIAAAKCYVFTLWCAC